MASVNVTIRLDEEDKKKFEGFCENVGLNITGAINMFIKATLRERVIPFRITDVSAYEVSPPYPMQRGRDSYGQY
jgi:DNA-damage-inducible protein J